MVASGATATTLPPSPLGPRAGVAALWTGSEVLVWGGYRGSGIPLALQTGAAYDPATGSWRSIADNAWAHPGALATWAGDRMVVLAKNGGAEYTPATDTWRDLPLLPDGVDGSFRGVVWTGDDVLGLVRGSQSVSVARLDRGTQTWSVGKVEALLPPSSTATDSVAWTGDELIYWSGGTEGAAYRPATGRWRALPPLPGDRATVRSVVTSAAGGIVVVVSARGVGDDAVVTVSRETETGWLEVASAPEPGFAVPAVAVDGRTVYVVDRAGVAPMLRIDVDERTVTKLGESPLRPGEGTAAVWAGDGLFVWGGLPAGTPMTFANPTPDAADAAWYPDAAR